MSDEYDDDGAAYTEADLVTAATLARLEAERAGVRTLLAFAAAHDLPAASVLKALSDNGRGLTVLDGSKLSSGTAAAPNDPPVNDDADDDDTDVYTPSPDDAVEAAFRLAEEAAEAGEDASDVLELLAARVGSVSKAWDESKHKRDHGKFSSTGGGAKTKTGKEAAPKKPTKTELKQQRRAEAKTAAHAHLKARAAGKVLNASEAADLIGHLAHLTHDDLKELRKEHGARFGGERRKEMRVQALVKWAKNEMGAKRRAQQGSALQQTVDYGGIDPHSADFKRFYGSMKDAVNDGIPMAAFKRGGNGLDEIAAQMVGAGHLNLPDWEDPSEHLIGLLRGRKMLNWGSEDKKHADAYAEHVAGQLEGDGGGATFDPNKMWDDEDPDWFRKAAAHAPAGGVSVQGKDYAGGEFIPADVMASATDEEKAAVEGKGKGGDSSPVESPGLLSKLPETEDEAVAFASAARDAIIGPDESDRAVDGDCTRAANALVRSHPEIEYWHGEYNGEVGHAIVKVGDWFIDITSDQFEGGDPIRVWSVDEHEAGVLGNYPEYAGFRRMKGSEKKARESGTGSLGIIKELPKYKHGLKLVKKALHNAHADATDAERLAAAVDIALAALADGTDPQEALDRLHAHDGATVEKANWDETKHPRSKTGQFISRDAIADAKTDPAKAKELRAKVKPADAQKLEDALSGKTDLGTTKKRQAKDAAGAKREAVKANRAKARELRIKLADQESRGEELNPDDLRALIPHLSQMTHEELSRTRAMLERNGATFGGKRLRADRVAALVAWATGKAEAKPEAESGSGAGNSPDSGTAADADAPAHGGYDLPVGKGPHPWEMTRADFEAMPAGAHVTQHAESIRREGFRARRGQGVGGSSGSLLWDSADPEYSPKLAAHLNGVRAAVAAADPVDAAAKYVGLPADQFDRTVAMYAAKAGRPLTDKERAAVIAFHGPGLKFQGTKPRLGDDLDAFLAKPFEVVKTRGRNAQHEGEIFGRERAFDEGDLHLDDHRHHVAAALAAGKPVPAEVLADYPDLAAKYAKPDTGPAAAQPAPTGTSAAPVKTPQDEVFHSARKHARRTAELAKSGAEAVRKYVDDEVPTDAIAEIEDAHNIKDLRNPDAEDLKALATNTRRADTPTQPRPVQSAPVPSPQQPAPTPEPTPAPASGNIDKVYSIADAAKELGISPQEAMAAFDAKKLRGYRVPGLADDEEGGGPRIPHTQLERFRKEQSGTSAAPVKTRLQALAEKAHAQGTPADDPNTEYEKPRDQYNAFVRAVVPPTGTKPDSQKVLDYLATLPDHARERLDQHFRAGGKSLREIEQFHRQAAGQTTPEQVRAERAARADAGDAARAAMTGSGAGEKYKKWSNASESAPVYTTPAESLMNKVSFQKWHESVFNEAYSEEDGSVKDPKAVELLRNTNEQQYRRNLEIVGKPVVVDRREIGEVVGFTDDMIGAKVKMKDGSTRLIGADSLHTVGGIVKHEAEKGRFANVHPEVMQHFAGKVADEMLASGRNVHDLLRDKGIDPFKARSITEAVAAEYARRKESAAPQPSEALQRARERAKQVEQGEHASRAPKSGGGVADLPPSIRSQLETHLSKLKDHAENLARGREMDKKYRGEGRYEAEAHGKISRDEADSFLAEFRKFAPQNGIDAERAITEAGGIPDLSLSTDGQSWKDDVAASESERAANPDTGPAAAQPAPTGTSAAQTPTGTTAAPDLAALKRNPKADLEHIAALQKQHAEGSPEWEALETARFNAQNVHTRDNSALAALHGKGNDAEAHGRRHFALERLASAAAQAHEAGDAAGHKAATDAVTGLGGALDGPAAGETTTHNPARYDAPAGVFQGHEVRVTRQPVTYNGALVYRGKVEPVASGTGAAPAAGGGGSEPPKVPLVASGAGDDAAHPLGHFENVSNLGSTFHPLRHGDSPPASTATIEHKATEIPGKKSYIARVSGLSDKYGLDRQFIPEKSGKADYSKYKPAKAGSAWTVTHTIPPGGGVYEINEHGDKHVRVYYPVRKNGAVVTQYSTSTPEQVKEAFAALAKAGLSNEHMVHAAAYAAGKKLNIADAVKQYLAAKDAAGERFNQSAKPSPEQPKPPPAPPGEPDHAAIARAHGHEAKGPPRKRKNEIGFMSGAEARESAAGFKPGVVVQVDGKPHVITTQGEASYLSREDQEDGASGKPGWTVRYTVVPIA